MPEKTVAQKLNLKPGEKLWLFNIPENIRPLLSDAQANLVTSGPADVILCFLKKQQELSRHLVALKAALAPTGRLWIVYPKAGKLGTDLNRDIIWKQAGPVGLQAVAMIAIDETWSALRLKVS
jgi:hypothetical protein